VKDYFVIIWSLGTNFGALIGRGVDVEIPLAAHQVGGPGASVSVVSPSKGLFDVASEKTGICRAALLPGSADFICRRFPCAPDRRQHRQLGDVGRDAPSLIVFRPNVGTNDESRQ
jgi:hypothetical protein